MVLQRLVGLAAVVVVGCEAPPAQPSRWEALVGANSSERSPSEGALGSLDGGPFAVDCRDGGRTVVVVAE